MDWCIRLIILSTIHLVSSNYGVPHDLGFQPNEKKWLEPPVPLENEESPVEDVKVESLKNLLMMTLSNSGDPKLLYVEDHQIFDDELNLDTLENQSEEINSPFKRTRYLRRQYPLKRQNSIYDSPSRYLCQPSKDEVFRLLLALQDARQENSGKIINFCNRKRPASSIFRNIRVLH